MIYRLVKLTKLVSILSMVLIFGYAAKTFAQDVARGYATADKDLRPGMVVSFSKGSDTTNTPEVERADLDNAEKVIGVAISSDESLVTIASGSDEIYVQSKGEVSVFATDLNGSIRKGDIVSASPLKGSIMKASETSLRLGIALEDFPGEAEETPITGDSLGKTSVKVARIKVTLASGLAERNPALSESSLQRIGRSIAKEDVGEAQALVALIIFLILMVAEGSIIYGGVSSAITALGRNPLAKKIIVKELVRLLGMVIFVFMIGLLAIYVVLEI